MDTLTQGLLGAATAQLGFRQRIGRDATWAAAVAAVVPDLDFLLAVAPEWSARAADGAAMTFSHRGVTHSLLFAPVIAAAVAGAWWLWRRRRNHNRPTATDPTRNPHRRRAGLAWLYACCLVAVLSHPLLDWCTSYGTQLFAPLTNTRYALDAVAIIDLPYTSILVVTLLVCRLLRKFTPSRPGATLAVGWAGFLLGVGYLGCGRLLHDRAVNIARSLAGRRDVLRADAYPGIGTIFLWRTVVETPDEWLVARVRPLRGGHPSSQPRTVAKAEDEWVRRARALEAVKTYRWFAMGRVRASCRPADGARVVEFHDMRYGLPLDSPESLWPLRVVFDSDGGVVSITRAHRRREGGFGRTVRQIWRDMWAP